MLPKCTKNLIDHNNVERLFYLQSYTLKSEWSDLCSISSCLKELVKYFPVLGAYILQLVYTRPRGAQRVSEIALAQINGKNKKKGPLTFKGEPIRSFSSASRASTEVLPRGVNDSTFFLAHRVEENLLQIQYLCPSYCWASSWFVTFHHEPWAHARARITMKYIKDIKRLEKRSAWRLLLGPRLVAALPFARNFDSTLPARHVRHVKCFSWTLDRSSFP